MPPHRLRKNMLFVVPIGVFVALSVACCVLTARWLARRRVPVVLTTLAAFGAFFYPLALLTLLTRVLHLGSTYRPL
jgi:hypothetical protein